MGSSKNIAIIMSFAVILLTLTVVCLVFTMPTAEPANSFDAAKALRDTLNKDADSHTSPCRNFYQHVCGGWLQRHSQEDSVFMDLEAEIDARIRKMAEDGWPIVNTWYETCMDGRTREAVGLSSLRALVNPILDAILTETDLFTQVARLHRIGVSAFFEPVVAPRDDNSSLLAVYLSYPQTLVPAEIYFGANASVLADYKARAQQIAELVLGSQQQATAALSIEKQLLDTMNDTEYILLPLSLTDPYRSTLLNSTQPGPEIFGLPFVDRAWAIATASNDLPSVRAYLVLRTAAAVIGTLPLMSLPSSASCVSSLRRWLSPVLSHYYASSYSSADARNGASDVLAKILSAYNGLLQHTQWMDKQTRDAAIDKLHKIKALIAFPDHWSTVINPELVHAGDHVGNALRILAATKERELDSTFFVREKYAWHMASYEVNAYYDMTANDIVFPAGIVQVPFFNVSGPMAANYGGLGTVIGHEVGHAFDNTGRLYDANGDLSEWWTQQSEAAYEVRARCVSNAYNNLPEAPGIYVDGNLTLGENWADLTGLKAAYNAFQLELRSMGADIANQQAEFVLSVFGYSQEQLFFRSWAHHWCSHYTYNTELALALSDTHSPDDWRVNIPAMQSAEFRAAFGCRKPSGVELCDLFKR